MFENLRFVNTETGKTIRKLTSQEEAKVLKSFDQNMEDFVMEMFELAQDSTGGQADDITWDNRPELTAGG